MDTQAERIQTDCKTSFHYSQILDQNIRIKPTDAFTRSSTKCSNKKITCLDENSYRFCFNTTLSTIVYGKIKRCPKFSVCEEDKGKFPCIKDRPSNISSELLFTLPALQLEEVTENATTPFDSSIINNHDKNVILNSKDTEESTDINSVKNKSKIQYIFISKTKSTTCNVNENVAVQYKNSFHTDIKLPSKKVDKEKIKNSTKKPIVPPKNNITTVKITPITTTDTVSLPPKRKKKPSKTKLSKTTLLATITKYLIKLKKKYIKKKKPIKLRKDSITETDILISNTKKKPVITPSINANWDKSTTIKPLNRISTQNQKEKYKKPVNQVSLKKVAVLVQQKTTKVTRKPSTHNKLTKGTKRPQFYVKPLKNSLKMKIPNNSAPIVLTTNLTTLEAPNINQESINNRPVLHSTTNSIYTSVNSLKHENNISKIPSTTPTVPKTTTAVTESIKITHLSSTAGADSFKLSTNTNKLPVTLRTTPNLLPTTTVRSESYKITDIPLTDSFKYSTSIVSSTTRTTPNTPQTTVAVTELNLPVSGVTHNIRQSSTSGSSGATVNSLNIVSNYTLPPFPCELLQKLYQYSITSTTTMAPVVSGPPATCNSPAKYPGQKCNEYYECLKVMWWYRVMVLKCKKEEAFDPTTLQCKPDKSCV